MVYKGKINGCTGFKMGKELKSMSVMIIIPIGIEKNGGGFVGGDGSEVYECDRTPRW